MLTNSHIQKTIQLLNREVRIDFDDAVVIHSNKYNSAFIGFPIIPFISKLHTDVVFRDAKTGEDRKLYLKNTDLPLYTGQSVSIISIEGVIIGYIDKQTQLYYYTQEDLCYAFGLGMSSYLLLLLGLITGAITYIKLLPDSAPAIPIIAAFAVIYLVYRIQKYIVNYRVTRKLDRVLQDG